jgi:tripartite-type tricarboxylate transporter receptor subunit TctC
MFAAPATPADRIATLREAYAKAIKDPELVAEAKKGRMDMEPVSGEDLQALAKRIMNQPPVVVERVKKILGQ